MKNIRTSKCGHLGENALFEAVAFPGEASRETMDHIESCPSCKKEAFELGESLAKLGRMAVASVPAPTGRILLPADEPRLAAAFRGKFLKTAVGSAFAVVLAVIVAWPLVFDKPASVSREQLLHAENTLFIFDDPGAFAENVLPSDYIAMAGESTEDYAVTDDGAVADDTDDYLDQAGDGGDFLDYASPA